MKAEIDGWSIENGMPTFRITLKGHCNDLAENKGQPPHIGFSMKEDGTFFAWFNQKQNVIKIYPVMRKNPWVAKSTLRLLSAVVSAGVLKMTITYETQGSQFGVLRPQIIVSPEMKEHTTYFNSDSIMLWQSMRDRLSAVMQEKGIAPEESAQ